MSIAVRLIFQNSKNAFSVCVRLDREFRRQNPLVVKAEVHNLIYENSSEGGIIIYAAESVVQHMCRMAKW